MWRPAFAYARSEPAFVRGWIRRFWQGSPDHRGVPEAPGRVVTLLPGAERDRVWGVVYQIAPGHEREVLEGLDHREQRGYARHEVAVHTATETIPDALVYVATERNPNWLG